MDARRYSDAGGNIAFQPKDTYSDMSLLMQRIGLTRREMEVACLVCSGITDKEIASRLFISNYTAKDHVKSIYRKVGVHNRSQLILALRK